MKYTSRQYATALYELIEKEPTKAREHLKRFVESLSRNGQLGLARDIVRDFEMLWNEKRGIVPVEITAAEERAVSKKKLEEMLGSTIELVEKTDPALGAGIRMRIGDYQIDNTLARRMQELKNAVAH